jgi:hypothetical protein
LPLARRILSQATRLSNNWLVRDSFAALGLTVLYLILVLKEMPLEPWQNFFYHWSGSASNFFVPVALNILAVWFVIMLPLLFTRKPGRTRVAIWTGLILLTSCVYTHLNIFYHRLSFLNLGSVAFIGAVSITFVLTALWRPELDGRYERVLAPVTTILIFLGIFGAFLLCNLALHGWEGHLFAKRSTLHSQQASGTIQPHRIIWIVFDELSQQETYDHRFPDLQLPAFDALAAGATTFTHTQPFDIYTEVVLPGLLTGKPFDDMRTSATLQLSLHNTATGKWQKFDQYDTVFQDALHAGYSTALAGWYNPYCRILPGVLDKCFWTYEDQGQTIMSPSATTLSNTLVLGRSLVISPMTMMPHRMGTYLVNLLHSPLISGEAEDRELHIKDYIDLNTASDKLLRDRSAGFVLLHLPVPHPQGIYDRKTGNLATTPSSYIDNLALADKCLAGIRATLEQTGQWDSSTIVIMGDHSWRTWQEWRRFPQWTKEDELVSHDGQYDPRPAYIVKLPGQTTGSVINTPYHTVNTRKLFDAIMAHQITTPAELAAWAQNMH